MTLSSISCSVFKSSSVDRILLGALSDTDICAMRVKFLTSPHDYPSGVSAGHIIPQWVLCSYRGRVNFPCFCNGVFSRRRWDSEEANVTRFSTWETPVLPVLPVLSVQLPVAREYLSPLDMVESLRACRRFMSDCWLTCFLSDSYASPMNRRNRFRNSPPSREPAKSSLFFP